MKHYANWRRPLEHLQETLLMDQEGTGCQYRIQ